MRIRFVNDVGEDIYVFESSDVAGVIAAVKESKDMVFDDHLFYKYDSMRINHYEENGIIIQELIVYFNSNE